MSNTKDIDVINLKLLILLYGKSGTGKTYFFRTCPKPCYVFDFDGGMLTLRGEDISYDFYGDTVRNGVLAKSGASQMEKKLRILQREADKGKLPYTTIGIDSISTLQDSFMRRLLRDSGRDRGTKLEWGLLIDRLQEFLADLYKLNCHVVVTAHEQVAQDEVLGDFMIWPLIVGKKLPGKMPNYFDEVYRLQAKRRKKGETTYEIITRSTTRFTAKSRLGCLDTVEKPDFNYILKKVKETAAASNQ